MVDNIERITREYREGLERIERESAARRKEIEASERKTFWTFILVGIFGIAFILFWANGVTERSKDICHRNGGEWRYAGGSGTHVCIGKQGQLVPSDEGETP